MSDKQLANATPVAVVAVVHEMLRFINEIEDIDVSSFATEGWYRNRIMRLQTSALNIKLTFNNIMHDRLSSN